MRYDTISGYEETSDYWYDYAKSDLERMFPSKWKAFYIWLTDRRITLKIEGKSKDEVLSMVKIDEVEKLHEKITFLTEEWRKDLNAGIHRFIDTMDSEEEIDSKIEYRRFLNQALKKRVANFSEETSSCEPLLIIDGFGSTFFGLSFIYKYGIYKIPMKGNSEYMHELARFKKYIEENCDIDFLLSWKNEKIYN